MNAAGQKCLGLFLREYWRWRFPDKAAKESPKVHHIIPGHGKGPDKEIVDVDRQRRWGFVGPGGKVLLNIPFQDRCESNEPFGIIQRNVEGGSGAYFFPGIEHVL